MFLLDSGIWEQLDSLRRIVCGNWGHSGFVGTKDRTGDRRTQMREEGDIAEILESCQVQRVMDEGALVSNIYAVACLSLR